MNRIEEKFNTLRHNKRKAFIAFITAGDPDLKTTGDVVLELEKSGVDIIELGVPFSDSLADGPIIQASYVRALNHGASVKKILEVVKHIRRYSSIPIALMSAYNPVFHFGEEKFIKACVDCGVDGLIIPDLPTEEASLLRRAADHDDVATIFFVAPTSQDDRIRANTKASRGFVYYISLTGITGTQKAKASAVIQHIKHIKRFTSKPVCVGFGISTPQQVRAISRMADGVIVGSALVKTLEKNRGRRDIVKRLGAYVRSLRKGLD